MLADRILALLAERPQSAPELAARLGADDLAVRRELGRLLGTRVAIDGGCWRLLMLPAGAALANLSLATEAVCAGLRAQAEGA